MGDKAARIVHVTTAHAAGDIRIFWKECVCLAEAGFDVYLLAVCERDHDVKGVHVIALPALTSRWRRMLLGPWRAWRALRTLRPDVVHVHDPELIPLALLWRILKHPAAAVYDAHEDLPKQVMGKAYIPPRLRPALAYAGHALERSADRWLDGVVAATPAIARKYHHAPVVLVQNFPWLRDFPVASPMDDACTDVVYIGAIAQGRGALEMMRAVEASTREARLLLVGPVASAELRRNIEHSQTAKYIGRVSASEVPQLIADARLGLAVLHPLPNYLEAQSTKLFEYMAAGRPFIASNFPSWLSLLGPYDCGLFVDPLDTDALTAAIDSLLGDVQMARSMGERGRAALLHHFGFEREAVKLIGMTSRLLK